jgi:hypothetical protein
VLKQCLNSFNLGECGRVGDDSPSKKDMMTVRDLILESAISIPCRTVPFPEQSPTIGIGEEHRILFARHSDHKNRTFF